MSPHCWNWALCLQSENESRMAWYSDLTCLSSTCFPLSIPPRNKKNGSGGFTWGWWWAGGRGRGSLLYPNQYNLPSVPLRARDRGIG